MGDEKSSSSNVMASRDREPRDRASHSAGGLRRRRCIVQTLLVFLLLPAHRPRDVFQSCWELGIKKVHEMCDPISNSDHFLYHVVVYSLCGWFLLSDLCSTWNRHFCNCESSVCDATPLSHKQEIDTKIAAEVSGHEWRNFGGFILRNP